MNLGITELQIDLRTMGRRAQHMRACPEEAGQGCILRGGSVRDRAHLKYRAPARQKS